MNIILFGPPGIGKSTIIGKLKDASVRAVDLEDVYPNKIRFQLPNMLSHVIIGAADLDPKHKYPNSIKVLLTLPQKDYEARRIERDKKIPEKAHQKVHSIEDWKKGAHYDYIFDADKNVVSKVIKLWNTYKEEKKDEH